MLLDFEISMCKLLIKNHFQFYSLKSLIVEEYMTWFNKENVKAKQSILLCKGLGYLVLMILWKEK